MPRLSMRPRWHPSCAVDGPARLALRGTKRLRPRLQRRPACAIAPNALRLRLGDDGTLESLRWEEFAPAAPGPGEVRVRVVATGINFRDVLLALRMYPAADASPGAECAGVVEAVGDGVTGLRRSVTESSDLRRIVSPASSSCPPHSSRAGRIAWARSRSRQALPVGVPHCDVRSPTPGQHRRPASAC